MDDCVFDASFIAKANGHLAGEKQGNLLNRRLSAIRQVTSGKSRIRYNPKLLDEYCHLVKELRNDIVDQFVTLLEDENTVRLSGSTLCRQDKAKANKCRWPTHDQHVLAAAVGGKQVTIHVTENALGGCSVAVKKCFGFKVNYVA
jgi:hypothetical protein